MTYVECLAWDVCRDAAATREIVYQLLVAHQAVGFINDNETRERTSREFSPRRRRTRTEVFFLRAY